MIQLKGYLLSEEQANEIKGVFFNDDTFFNPLLSVDSKWFVCLNESDLSDFNTTYNWVLDLPYEDFDFENEEQLDL
jgi:hypothetical protein